MRVNPKEVLNCISDTYQFDGINTAYAQIKIKYSCIIVKIKLDRIAQFIKQRQFYTWGRS